MTILGTALCENATKVLLLGSGELGKEVAIECQRLGLEVIAADRYAQAPAMHVAHRSYVIDMLDASALKSLIKQENPHFIVPEIEAIATQALIELENEGYRVVPCANATQITMNRESIRRLAAQELSLPCSTYRFADNENEFRQAVNDIGLPCIIKPIMSSSGKGQSLIHNRDQLAQAWRYSQLGGRTGEGKVIVEGFIKFDFEITLLTIHAVDGIHFCAPIGHHQENGDYRESWQPQKMSEAALNKAKSVASSIVKALGGYGLFGVELFVSGDDVIFNEISPRPHDTGMVTLLSQNLSEFALHVRAFLGLPIGNIRQYGACASAAILPKLTSKDIKFGNLDSALQTNTQIRLFSKPNIEGTRRLGVTLAQADSVEQAIFAAKTVAENVEVMP